MRSRGATGAGNITARARRGTGRGRRRCCAAPRAGEAGESGRRRCGRPLVRRRASPERLRTDRPKCRPCCCSPSAGLLRPRDPATSWVEPSAVSERRAARRPHRAPATPPRCLRRAGGGTRNFAAAGARRRAVAPGIASRRAAARRSLPPPELLPLLALLPASVPPEPLPLPEEPLLLLPVTAPSRLSAPASWLGLLTLVPYSRRPRPSPSVAARPRPGSRTRTPA